jgi:hypothetical protein
MLALVVLSLKVSPLRFSGATPHLSFFLFLMGSVLLIFIVFCVVFLVGSVLLIFIVFCVVSRKL